MKILASVGHAEYNLPDTVGVTVTEIWDPYDSEEGYPDSEPDLHDIESKTGESMDDLPDADWTWEHVVRIEGEPNAIVKALGGLLVDLSFTPGGDDGTFDYWPSGMRFARQLIDQLGAQFPYNTAEYGDIASRGGSNGLLALWEAVARHVILDKDELGYERADLAYELFDKIGWLSEAEKHREAALS